MATTSLLTVVWLQTHQSLKHHADCQCQRRHSEQVLLRRLGQLIREDNRARNCSMVYEYDNAGNITAKKKYAFTTGTLGTVQTTDTCSMNKHTPGRDLYLTRDEKNNQYQIRWSV